MMMKPRSIPAVICLLAVLMYQLLPHAVVAETDTNPLLTGQFSYCGAINQAHDATAAYYYSDSYFDHSAKEYDPHLATMSLCLELSGLSSKDADNWPQKTQNARALLQELAFQDIYQNTDWDQKPSMHSLGLVLAYKNIGASTVVAVVVRGGGYFAEWGGNFVVGTQGDHEGFDHGRQIVLHELEQYVSQHQLNSDFQPTLKLWIVGFSRGGAVAEMTAAHLTDQGQCGNMELSADNIFAYTFEAAQGHAGEEKAYPNIHNLINPMDVVPLVAPAALGFDRYQKASTFAVPLLGTKDYALRRDAICRQYEQVLAGVRPDGVTKPAEKIRYMPDPYVIAPDWTSLVEALIEPEAEIQWIRQSYLHTTEETLYGGVDSLFGAIADGREGYVRDAQQSLSHLIMFLMDYDAEIDWQSAVNEALFANDNEGLNQLLTILLDSETDLETKEEQASAIAMEHLLNAVLHQTGTNLNNTESAVSSLVAAMIDAMITNPQQTISFLYYLVKGNGIQAHWPEVTLAILMAQDSYYTGSEMLGPQPDSFRMIEICGVGDAAVLDENDQRISWRIGESVENTSEIHGLAVTDDDMIHVVLPSDAAYTIDMLTTADEVTVTVYEYSSLWQQYTRAQVYQQTTTQGSQFSLFIPAYAAEDYTDLEKDGSETLYTLRDSTGEMILPVQTLRGVW